MSKPPATREICSKTIGTAKKDRALNFNVMVISKVHTHDIFFFTDAGFSRCLISWAIIQMEQNNAYTVHQIKRKTTNHAPTLYKLEQVKHKTQNKSTAERMKNIYTRRINCSAEFKPKCGPIDLK